MEIEQCDIIIDYDELELEMLSRQRMDDIYLLNKVYTRYNSPMWF